MITAPALRIRQFQMEFFQVTFSAGDVAKLVEFIVLEAETGAAKKKRGKGRAEVNWQLLESLVKTGDTAYQRPLIRKKIEDLVEYYRQCAEEERTPMPAIPGAVILVARDRVEFSPSSKNPDLGLVQIPEQYGFLHALDGQHRLVALHAARESLAKLGDFQVPAVLFDRLESSQEVEMFATINCKQTKLNSSLIVSLSGKRLYQDQKLVTAHEIARKLNEDAGSPLAGQVKMLGVGKGRLSQVALTNPLSAFIALDPRPIRDLDEVKDFFIRYVKQLGQVFPEAWSGRKYSIASPVAIRAFIAAAPEVIARIKAKRESVTDALAIRRALEPWKTRITSARFETAGEWQRKLAVSARKSSDLLARELMEALAMEEG